VKRRTFLGMSSVGLVMATARLHKAVEEIPRAGFDPSAETTSHPRVVTAVDGVWVVSVQGEAYTPYWDDPRDVDHCCRVTFLDRPEMAGRLWIPPTPPVTGDAFPAGPIVSIREVCILSLREQMPEALTIHARGQVLGGSGFEEDTWTIHVKCGSRIHFLGPTFVHLKTRGLLELGARLSTG
jgi:hypothetical protein